MGMAWYLTCGWIDDVTHLLLEFRRGQEGGLLRGHFCANDVSQTDSTTLDAFDQVAVYFLTPLQVIRVALLIS